MNALCEVSEVLRNPSDAVGVERWLLLSARVGERVELLLGAFLVSVCFVDPFGDDGGVGAGVEGGLVAGEAAAAVLDRFAGLSLPSAARPR